MDDRASSGGSPPRFSSPTSVVKLDIGTRVYHKTWFVFPPMANRSHFYTLHRPLGTTTDRGATVLVYHTTCLMMLPKDESEPGQPPLKLALHNHISGTNVDDIQSVNIPALCQHMQTFGYKGFISRMDRLSPDYELILCEPPDTEMSPLLHDSTYTV